MEGVGLLAASTASEPIWCIVKGISDFAILIVIIQAISAYLKRSIVRFFWFCHHFPGYDL